MWPFKKRHEFYGIEYDVSGNPVFDFTDEEKEQIQRSFKTYFPEVAKGESLIHKSVVDEFQRAVYARGLYDYARHQIETSKLCESRKTKNTYLDRSISSLIKAYSLYPLPIIKFHLAYAGELAGQDELAKSTYREFLDEQNCFKPNQVQSVFQAAILLDLPLEEAVRISKEKLL